MKTKLFPFLLSLVLLSCSQQDKKQIEPLIDEVIHSIDIPDISLSKSEIDYDNKTSLWTVEGEKFSGYALSYFPDSSLQQKFGIIEGRKQNEAITWYEDGHKKHSSNYHQGKLEGSTKSWSPDSAHILVSDLHYKNGKAHGIQRKWYSTGEIFKVINLNMGIEEGMQEAYRKNGDMFANYEAKEGRFFGLKKASLCYGLEDEKIKYVK